MSGRIPAIDAGHMYERAVDFYHDEEWRDGEPYREIWVIGKRETAHGEVSDGEGQCVIYVLEVVESKQVGQIVIFKRDYYAPDETLLSKPRRRTMAIRSFKAYLSKHKFKCTAWCES